MLGEGRFRYWERGNDFPALSGGISFYNSLCPCYFVLFACCTCPKVMYTGVVWPNILHERAMIYFVRRLGLNFDEI